MYLLSTCSCSAQCRPRATVCTRSQEQTSIFMRLSCLRKQVEQLTQVFNACVWDKCMEQTTASRLTRQQHPHRSHSESRWWGLTPPRNLPTHTHTPMHTQTWSATQGPPWPPLTCLSIQQWVTPSILCHLSICMNVAAGVCVSHKSPKVSKSKNRTRCSFPVKRPAAAASQSRQQLCCYIILSCKGILHSGWRATDSNSTLD